MAFLAVLAELRLLDFAKMTQRKGFCSQQGLRKQLSILIGKRIDDSVKDRKTGVERPRFSVELALVSRVFLARSIQTSMGEDGGTRGNVGVNRQAVLPAAAARAAPAAAGANSDAKPQPSRSDAAGRPERCAGRGDCLRAPRDVRTCCCRIRCCRGRSWSVSRAFDSGLWSEG